MDQGWSISVDTFGNVYITDYFSGTADFDPGDGTTRLASVGGYDFFVQKMNQGGVNGILNVKKGIKVSAYPNPSKGSVQIVFEQVLKNIEIELIDLKGRVVFTRYLNVASSEEIIVDGHNGIYFLRIKTPHEQSVLKLVKEL